MKKIKSEEILSNIRENEKLENKKKMILKKYSRYWGFPSYVKRELREIEAKKETNDIEYKRIVKRIY